MMKKTVLILIFAFLFSVFTPEAGAQEQKGFLIRLWDKISSRWKGSPSAEVPDGEEAVREEPDTDRTPAAGSPRFVITKEALIEEINKGLTEYPELVERIPSVVKRKSMDGTVEYYYKYSSDIPMKLEKYERKVLSELLDLIDQEIKILRQQKPVEEPARAEVQPQPLPEPPVEDLPEPGETPEVGDTYPEKPTRDIPFTREKMLEVISQRVKTFSQIEYLIPDFYAQEGPEGAKEYFYRTDMGDMPIVDLDKETLHRLFVRINNEATRLNSQRVMRQIQQQDNLIRTLQQQTRQVHQQPPQPVQSPPTIHQPPQQPPQPPPQPQQRR